MSANRSDTGGEIGSLAGLAALGSFQPGVQPMSLRPQQPIPPVPDDTARVARAAFGTRNPYLDHGKDSFAILTHASLVD